jgi:hypothetical protein
VGVVVTPKDFHGDMNARFRERLKLHLTPMRTWEHEKQRRCDKVKSNDGTPSSLLWKRFVNMALYMFLIKRSMLHEHLNVNVLFLVWHYLCLGHIQNICYLNTSHYWHLANYAQLFTSKCKHVTCAHNPYPILSMSNILKKIEIFKGEGPKIGFLSHYYYYLFLWLYMTNKTNKS